MGRRLKFNIFRYNPQDPDSIPHTETFYLDETESMTLFIALTQIRACLMSRGGTHMSVSQGFG